MPRTSQHQSSIWQADLLSLLLMILFVILVAGMEWLVQPRFSQASLVLTGILLSLVPAALWLAFFYRRDFAEPEPKGLVFQVFLLGGLLAAALGIPLRDNLFRVDTWLHLNFVTQLLGGILVVGFSHEFLKYATVRFSVYRSAEFDEPIDGIIYATAAGLGYATTLNIDFVVQSGGVDLSSGVIRIVVTAMAHASFAGITGYFLGLEKFGRRPVWSTAAGVSLAAVLNGTFFYLRNSLARAAISTAGGYAQRWVGFVLATLLAGAVTLALATMIRRQARPARAVEEA